MQTWTDVTYKLPDNALLVTTPHPHGRVSFSCPGYALDGRGFTLQFTAAHLPQLQQLVRTLEQMVVEPSSGVVLHAFGTDDAQWSARYGAGESLADFEAWRDRHTHGMTPQLQEETPA